jgi:hypothetical protein
LYDLTVRQRHMDLAAAAFPGPNYYEVLRWIHESLQPATYIEIGVRRGISLRAALDETICLAIDPNPMLDGYHPRLARVFTTTSDEFFRRQDVPSLLNAPHFALAFIDGQHLWEQALRDFTNLERYAGRESVILIHDCLPLDEITSARTQSTAFYSGDVWKLALCLQAHRPDLRIATVRTWPTGLCMVTGLDPASRVLTDGYWEFVRRYTPLDYAGYLAFSEKLPRTLENDRDVIDAWLAEARSSHGNEADAGA